MTWTSQQVAEICYIQNIYLLLLDSIIRLTFLAAGTSREGVSGNPEFWTFLPFNCTSLFTILFHIWLLNTVNAGAKPGVSSRKRWESVEGVKQQLVNNLGPYGSLDDGAQLWGPCLGLLGDSSADVTKTKEEEIPDGRKIEGE